MKNKRLILIIFIAILIRTVFFVALGPWDEQVAQDKVLIEDAVGYNRVALSIVESKTFSSVGTTWTPGYPLFVAFIYFLFGYKIFVVLLLQNLLDVGIVIIIYFLAKELFESKRIAIISAFLYSISFLSIGYANMLRNETLFTFIFALLILIFIRALKECKVWKFALIGFIMGIATLIRPILLYFPIIICVILLLQKNKLTQKMYNILIFLAMFFITLSPWQLRNLNTFGHYSLSTIRGHTLYRFNVAITKANVENKSRAQARNELREDIPENANPFEKDKIAQKTAIEYILQHPMEYTFYHLKGVLNTFVSTAKGEIVRMLGLKVKLVNRLELSEGYLGRAVRTFRDAPKEYFLTPILITKQLLEYSFCLLGLAAIYSKGKRKLYMLLLLLTILYFTMPVGPQGYQRFRVPIVPFYLVLSAKGIFAFFDLLRKRSRHENV